MEMLEKIIRDYLEEAKTLQIATLRGDQPWCCTVWYAHDEHLNLYWISSKTRRHSEEIKDHAKVAGTIVLPHTQGSGQKVRGIQFEGTAQETSGTSQSLARDLYIKKYARPQDYHEEVLVDPNAEANWYMITPTKIVLFDQIHYPDSPRQEFIPRGR